MSVPKDAKLAKDARDEMIGKAFGIVVGTFLLLSFLFAPVICSHLPPGFPF